MPIPVAPPPPNSHPHIQSQAHLNPPLHPPLQPPLSSQQETHTPTPSVDANDSANKSEEKADTPKTLSKPSSPEVQPPTDKEASIKDELDKDHIVHAPTLNGHKVPKKTEAKFPLYINETRLNFNNIFPITEENRKINDIDRLNTLEDKIVKEKKVTLCPNYTKVFNINTTEEYITNGKDIRDTKDEPQPIQTQSQPSTNWASILQSSAPPVKKITKPKATKPVATGTATPIKSKPSTPDIFDIDSESAHPLGILLLKVMFDSNYSLSNNFPVFNIKPKGLTNTGNICFMNSILQSLLYCKPFNKLLKLIETKSIGDLGASTNPLIDATIKLFNEFKPSDNKLPVSIEPFYAALSKHKNFQHLRWGQQEDAEEFLGYYLDALNEEMIGALKKLNTPQVDLLIQSYTRDDVAKFKYNVKTCIKRIKKDDEETEQDDDEDAWNEVGTKKKNITKIEVDPTPLNMIFGGEFKSVITIPKATSSSSFQKSITLDPFQHVQLDISNSNSIEEAFIHLNELETISYKGNNNKEVEVKKQTFIEKLPQVLIIHLKRFSYSKDQENAIEKLAKNISYDHTLTIPSEILSQEQSTSKSSSNQYQLTSVVYHHGSSADAGHYTSDTFDFENNQWWEIDDTIVKPIKDDEVLSSGITNAYILLYSKI